MLFLYWGVDREGDALPRYGGRGAPEPRKHPHPIPHLGVGFTENRTWGRRPVFIVMICRSTLGILVPNKCCRCNGLQTPRKATSENLIFPSLNLISALSTRWQKLNLRPNYHPSFPLVGAKFLGQETAKVLVAGYMRSSATVCPLCRP